MNALFIFLKLTSSYSFHRSHIFWVNRSLPLWGLQVMYNFVLALYFSIYSYFPEKYYRRESVDVKNEFVLLLNLDAHLRLTLSFLGEVPCDQY